MLKSREYVDEQGKQFRKDRDDRDQTAAFTNKGDRIPEHLHEALKMEEALLRGDVKLNTGMSLSAARMGNDRERAYSEINNDLPAWELNDRQQLTTLAVNMDLKVTLLEYEQSLLDDFLTTTESYVKYFKGNPNIRAKLPQSILAQEQQAIQILRNLKVTLPRLLAIQRIYHLQGALEEDEVARILVEIQDDEQGITFEDFIGKYKNSPDEKVRLWIQTLLRLVPPQLQGLSIAALKTNYRTLKQQLQGSDVAIKRSELVALVKTLRERAVGKNYLKPEYKEQVSRAQLESVAMDVEKEFRDQFLVAGGKPDNRMFSRPSRVANSMYIDLLNNHADQVFDQILKDHDLSKLNELFKMHEQILCRTMMEYHKDQLNLNANLLSLLATRRHFGPLTRPERANYNLSERERIEYAGTALPDPLKGEINKEWERYGVGLDEYISILEDCAKKYEAEIASFKTKIIEALDRIASKISTLLLWATDILNFLPDNLGSRGIARLGDLVGVHAPEWARKGNLGDFIRLCGRLFGADWAKVDTNQVRELRKFLESSNKDVNEMKKVISNFSANEHVLAIKGSVTSLRKLQEIAPPAELAMTPTKPQPRDRNPPDKLDKDYFDDLKVRYDKKKAELKKAEESKDQGSIAEARVQFESVQREAINAYNKIIVDLNQAYMPGASEAVKKMMEEMQAKMKYYSLKFHEYRGLESVPWLAVAGFVQSYYIIGNVPVLRWLAPGSTRFARGVNAPFRWAARAVSPRFASIELRNEANLPEPLRMHNAELTPKARANGALEGLERELGFKVGSRDATNLRQAINDAHAIEPTGKVVKGLGVRCADGQYRLWSQTDLRQKINILKKAGFVRKETGFLIRNGYCGRNAGEIAELLIENEYRVPVAIRTAAEAEAATAEGVASRTGKSFNGTKARTAGSTRAPGTGNGLASTESAEARAAGEAFTAERAGRFKINVPQLRSVGARTLNGATRVLGAVGVYFEGRSTVEAYREMQEEVRHLETVQQQMIAELNALTTGTSPLLTVTGEGNQRVYALNGIPGVTFSIGQAVNLHNVTDAQINGWLQTGRRGAATIFFAAATLGAVSGGVALAAVPVIIAVDVGINFAKNSIAAHKRRQMLEQAPAWLLSYLGTVGVLGMTADQAFEENAGLSLLDFGPRSWTEAGLMVNPLTGPVAAGRRILGAGKVSDTKKANREKLLAIMAYNSAFRVSHGDIIRGLPHLGDPHTLLNPEGSFLRKGGDFERIVRRFAELRLVEKKRRMLVGEFGFSGTELINAVRLEDMRTLDPEIGFRRSAKWREGMYMFSPEEREEALREGMMFYIQHLRELRYKEQRSAIIARIPNDPLQQRQALETFDREVAENKDLWFVFDKHPKDLPTAGSSETYAMRLLEESERAVDNPENPLGAGRRDRAEHDALLRGAESVREQESEIVRPLADAERLLLEAPSDLRVYRSGDALPDKRLYTGKILTGWLRQQEGDLVVFDFRHPVQGDGGPLIVTVTSFNALGRDRSTWEITEKRDEYFDWGRRRSVVQKESSSTRTVSYERWASAHGAQAAALEAEFQRLESIGAEHDAKKKPAEDEQEFMKKLETLPNFDDREGKILERAKALPRQWHRYENRPGAERRYDYVACIPGTDFEPAYYLYLKMPKVPVRQLSMSAPGTHIESPKEEEYQGTIIAVMRENKTGFIYDVSGNYRRAFQGRGKYGPQIADGLGFPIIGDDEGSVKKVLAPYVKRIDQADARTMIKKALEFYVTLPVSDIPKGGKLQKRERFLRLLDTHLSRIARVEGEPGSYYYIQPKKFEEALEGAIKATEQ